MKVRQAGLKYHNPSRPDDAGPSKPGKVLHHIMHPVETVKAHKRKSPDRQAEPSKRKRVSDKAVDKNDVIEISDDEDTNDVVPVRTAQPERAASDVLNPHEVLKCFRIEPKTLR